MKFDDIIFVKYPVPKEYSVWSESIDADGEVLPALYSLEDLKKSCVADLSSDLFISETIRVSSRNFIMPEDTVNIQFCTLDYEFPGNKRIKYSYLKGTRMLNVIYTPCFVTYLRHLRVEDLDNLTGDRLRYFQCYFLKNMAEMELNVLKSVDLHTDNAAINLEALAAFANNQDEKFKELKPEILIYAGKF